MHGLDSEAVRPSLSTHRQRLGSGRKQLLELYRGEQLPGPGRAATGGVHHFRTIGDEIRVDGRLVPRLLPTTNRKPEGRNTAVLTLVFSPSIALSLTAARSICHTGPLGATTPNGSYSQWLPWALTLYS